MAESLVRLPSDYVRLESETAWEHFRGLRTAVMESGPLDSTTCELIMISGFGVAGYEDSFKVHSRRLLDGGVPMAALKQAVLVTLGGTAAVFQVARALQWLNELEQDRSED